MLHLITVIFVIAKIMNYVTFSWFLVFLPSIFAVTFPILVFIGLLIGAAKVMK